MPKLAVSFALASAVVAFAVIAGASNGDSGSSSSSNVQDGQKTCGELAACCGKIKEKGTRNTCVETYKAKAGNNAECDLVYPAFQLYCDLENAPHPPPRPAPRPKPAH